MLLFEYFSANFCQNKFDFLDLNRFLFCCLQAQVGAVSKITLFTWQKHVASKIFCIVFPQTDQSEAFNQHQKLE